MRVVLPILFLFLFLAGWGCGPKKVDMGDIRVMPAQPDNEVPAHAALYTAGEDSRSDYGGEEGLFRIIPPATINPRNLERQADPRILTIDFQQGFPGIRGRLLYQGEVIFDQRLLSNRDGFADSVNLRYVDVPVRITLQIPAYGLDESFVIDPEKGRFLGIAFESNQLMLNLQEGTFFYPPLKARAGAQAAPRGERGD